MLHAERDELLFRHEAADGLWQAIVRSPEKLQHERIVANTGLYLEKRLGLGEAGDHRLDLRQESGEELFWHLGHFGTSHADEVFGLVGQISGRAGHGGLGGSQRLPGLSKPGRISFWGRN